MLFNYTDSVSAEACLTSDVIIRRSQETLPQVGRSDID